MLVFSRIRVLAEGWTVSQTDTDEDHGLGVPTEASAEVQTPAYDGVVNRIVVSAVVMRDVDGRVLTVRKRGTSMFMFPGGKIDSGETPADAAVREAREEIGVDLAHESLRLLGEFGTAAANEPDHVVVATVFEHPLTGEPAPHAEIAELAWVDPASDRPDLAPLLREAVFPTLIG